jgi:FkbM family methyltransferase
MRNMIQNKILERIRGHIRAVLSVRGLTAVDTFKVFLSFLVGYTAIFVSMVLKPLEKHIKTRVGGYHVEFIHKIANLRHILWKSPDGLYFILRIGPWRDGWLVSSEFEPEVSSVFRPKQGEVVIDVGASIGAHAVRVARAVGNEGLVITLEPNAEDFKLLKMNLMLNKADNVIALPMAAYEKNGNNMLYLSKETGLHSLTRIPSSYIKKIEVSTITLDSLLTKFDVQRVDWIKLDVEGAELAVLKGASRVLEVAKNLIIEVWHKNAKGVFDLLNSKGYKVTVLTKNGEENFYIIARKTNLT